MLPERRYTTYLNRLPTNCIEHSKIYLQKKYGRMHDGEIQELDEYSELEDKYKVKSKVENF